MGFYIFFIHFKKNKMTTIPITELQKNLEKVMNRVIDNHSDIIVQRPNKEDIVLIPFSEYSSIKETLFLLSEHKNIKRLLKGIDEVKNNNTHRVDLSKL